ncbi:hypothetical protein ACWDUL_20405 [Nocardia niigatensis]
MNALELGALGPQETARAYEVVRLIRAGQEVQDPVALIADAQRFNQWQATLPQPDTTVPHQFLPDKIGGIEAAALGTGNSAGTGKTSPENEGYR